MSVTLPLMLLLNASQPVSPLPPQAPAQQQQQQQPQQAETQQPEGDGPTVQRPDGGLGTQVDPADPVDPEIIDGRRRPGYTGELPDPITQENEGAVRAPPPQAFPTDRIPIPDRWRLMQTLAPVLGPGVDAVINSSVLDPYHQNTYKGDRPICVGSEEEQQRRAAILCLSPMPIARIS